MAVVVAPRWWTLGVRTWVVPYFCSMRDGWTWVWVHNPFFGCGCAVTPRWRTSNRRLTPGGNIPMPPPVCLVNTASGDM
jgi:hypothetical protein